MDKHAQEFPVAVMCGVLEVSPSGFYAWRNRAMSSREQRHEMLGQAVSLAHASSRGVYGYRKVHKDVVEEHGHLCCEETVRVIMREKGLQARRKRRFITTTDSAHTMPVAQNLLDRNFEPERPNEKWVADITYIRTQEGWLYLAAVMDLFGRRVVGWHTSERIDTDLITNAFHAALRARRPEPGLLHHSDRGSQYASYTFQSLLEIFGIRCSMSRKGNCWDNACMERFFCSLKTEWIADTIYPTRQAARTAVFEYIETFYNTNRRHASLGYKTPVQYEAQANSQGKQAA
jgi:putative transposase